MPRVFTAALATPFTVLAFTFVRAAPFPEKLAAVMAPAAKLPDASRDTIELTVLDEVAVVRLLAKVPATLFALRLVSADPSPEKLTALAMPLTSRVAAGFAVAMPTFPPKGWIPRLPPFARLASWV